MTASANERFGVQLRLLHSHGERRDGVLRIPPEGCGLAAAADLAGQSFAPDAGAWDQCRIEWQGTQWAFSNSSAALVCAVNQARIGLDADCAIAPGDSLEIGLMRFGVEAVLASQAATTVEATRSPVGFAAPFDWRDLTSLDASVLCAAREWDDPFEVLGLSSEASGGQRIASAAFDGPKERCPEAPELGPLEVLNDEFARVVRDPTRLSNSHEWVEQSSPDRQPAPTLSQLSAHAQDYPLIRDIFQGREHVGAIIDGFDKGHENDLFQPVRTGEVLRLFAPKITADASCSLPQLTRREHHAVSLDSHMHLDPPRLKPVAPKEAAGTPTRFVNLCLPAETAPHNESNPADNLGGF